MKVGIIGGGPVGTTTAILLKSKCKEIQVHVFEQRAEFTRNQILLIDKNTWKLFPKLLRDDLEKDGCFVYPPSTDSTGRCYEQQRKDKKLLFSIRISLLEQKLWDYAKHIGVEMHRPNLSDKKKEMKISDSRLRDFDILIGAGGKNDILRQYLNIPLYEHQVSTAAILTWNPKKHISFHRNTTSSKSSSRHNRKKSGQNRYRMFRSKDTNYYATIQLTPNEAKLLEKDNVDTLEDIKNPEILKAFDNIFKYYDLQDGEYPNPTNGKISLVPISLYYAPDSVGVARLPNNNKSETLIFLVGDAVNGVHFFSGTGVNTGIKMASVVADAICRIQRRLGTFEKAVNTVKKYVSEYINEASVKSTNVILKSEMLGTCKRKTIKELRALAKQHNHVGISDLSKVEMCLIMNVHF